MEYKQALAAFAIICVAFLYLYATGHFSTDYYFHRDYLGDSNYPNAVAILLSPFHGVAQRSVALFFFNLLFSVYLPFIFIHAITKKWEASVIYLFSGIPVLLFNIWLVPQAIIQTIMLAAVFWPPMLFFFLFGPFIHEFWLPAFFVVIGYYLLLNEVDKWRSKTI